MNICKFFAATRSRSQNRRGGSPSQRSPAELALEDIVTDTERLGLYDADPAQIKAALMAARGRRAALDRMTEDASAAGLYEGRMKDYAQALKMARRRAAGPDAFSGAAFYDLPSS